MCKHFRTKLQNFFLFAVNPLCQRSFCRLFSPRQDYQSWSFFDYCSRMYRLIISVSSTTNRLIISLSEAIITHIHKQKAGLRCCCSAQRGSGKPYILNKQHCNPRYMCMYALCVYGNTHREHLRVAMFWNICEIYQISLSQNKALRRFFVIMSSHFTSQI